MEKTSHWAALYFVALMTFGNYVLFNLLVAILVEGFSAEVCCSEVRVLNAKSKVQWSTASHHVTRNVTKKTLVSLSWRKIKNPNAILWHLCARAVFKTAWNATGLRVIAVAFWERKCPPLQRRLFSKDMGLCPHLITSFLFPLMPPLASTSIQLALLHEIVCLQICAFLS